jgi:hypothetical protein
VQVVGCVLGHAERTPLREVEVHLRRCLGARRELEHDVHAVEQDVLAGAGDLHRRRDERDGAGRVVRTEAARHLPEGALVERGAVHVAGAPGHGRAGHQVLADGVGGEVLGGEDRDAAGLAVGQHATSTPEVVDVAVGVDEPGDGAIAARRAVEPERGGGGLGGDQRVDDDDALVALHQGHVGEVEPADLVGAGSDLEQAVHEVELGLAPQARVHRCRRRPADVAVGGEVPHHPAVGGPHHRVVQGGDEAPPGVLEVLVVVEGQRHGHRRVGPADVLGDRHVHPPG